MALMNKSIVSLVLLAIVLQSRVIECQELTTCSASLNNLNICAPFVVPGITNPNPSFDCCSAIQYSRHLRSPSLCNLPPLSCAEN